VYPDDGSAEIRRLKLMASSELPTRQRHRNTRSLPTNDVLVFGAFMAVLLLVGVLVAWKSLTHNPPAAPPHPSVLGTPASVVATSTPTPSPTPEDLVANAKRIKPLEDIKKGDRVIYQGHVCHWLLWDLNINTSTIKCETGKAFQIQTGRLTPVELATGKSKLKVRH
jgi:hypothetical protein